MSGLIVDLVASWPHYAAHLMPIWDKLPEELRGEVRIGPGAGRTPKRNRVCLVASWTDMAPLRGITEFIYVEHGAGQSYGGDPKSAHWPDYSASRGVRHVGVRGYICPSDRVAAMWNHPHSRAVGSPRLDQWLPDPPKPMPKTYCITFHWPCLIAPEAGSAFTHYEPALPEIVRHFAEQGWTGYCHVHPKWEGKIDRALADAGLIRLHNDDALLLPEVLLCDNSSTMYEAAALGRHVVALNCPEYRRDVHHGLRFWDAVPGWQAEDAQDLLTMTLRDAGDPYGEAMRDQAAKAAYKYLDGGSAQRAADAIVAWVS